MQPNEQPSTCATHMEASLTNLLHNCCSMLLGISYQAKADTMQENNGPGDGQVLLGGLVCWLTHDVGA